MLLLVGASRWAVSAARPEAESTLTSETLGCAWAALVALVILLPRRQRAKAQPRPPLAATLRWLLAGGLLFGGPAIDLLVPAHGLNSTALTIALTLTPIVIAVASSAVGTESSEGIAGRIWPSLAAVAGLLLVLVEPNLGDARADVLLLLAPVLAGTGAVLFCRDGRKESVRVPATLLGACGLFALGLLGSYVAGVRPNFSLAAIACDGIAALLGVAVLSRLGPTRWSSQFTWIPLLVILEGIALVRPKLTAHWFTGLVLLIIASVYLLLPAADEPSADASPAPQVPV